ncbi:MAG: M55 family metallopeptidase [Clostridia bacterium]|nr:M55 family metallopeptidase [Clostridia bacterium]
MTIYIETDLEGISGVSTLDQVASGSRHACERLMADTNAAIAGAFDGGADRVQVLDGHGGGHNFLDGWLDPRAEIAPIDAIRTCDACFCVGAHAMAGTQNAFLDHTQSSVAWHDYRINGRRYGETGQLAVFAGAWDVPFVMASGDFAACAEVRTLFGNIETAVVKTAIGRNRADCLPDDEAERLIRHAAARAVKLADSVRPFHVTFPMEIAVEFNRTDYADDAMARRPDAERIGPRTVRRIIREIRGYDDLMI